MKRVIQSKTRTKTGVILVFIALVIALGITCPSSAFALDETDADALAGAPVAQEQSIVLDTAQNVQQVSHNSSETLETSSNGVVEPNLDTPIESEKNKPEETMGVAAGQESALPALTGSVVIVNVLSPDGVEVGDTLAATLNGVQADALLHCQWYRGDTAIEGATSTNYVLVNTDVGQPITCRVTAENYRGVLISSPLIPSDQLVTVEYWSYTDASPDQEVIVHTETVRLSDVFNYRFDQNKDDDSSNDYLAKRTVGWYDDTWSELYSADWANDFGYADMSELTIQHIADMIGWDGVSPILLWSELDLRYITVYYDGGGFENENEFEEVRQISWYDSPYYDSLKWGGYELNMQFDDHGIEYDSSMTCEHILRDLWGEPMLDELYVYLDWTKLSYTVTFIHPNGSDTAVTLGYSAEIEFPETLLGLDPGYDFVGWYTEPDGGGDKIEEYTPYSTIEPSDKVVDRTLYAYFVPTGSAISVKMESQS